ncbi:hypothetical protein TTHERM_00137970 (macronuclear) [Tetrahymena thermophila SB210]|uniref:Uncharacterized protein n=1 Tax=Tetrahymena thermophila (strain SB210) TaxID=312017 RepID=I7M287_TETTS|nr:hypothetical protein TTHERM_00137970 [Tetrahymena thermophila SB210]EAR99534.2 hypothetical protein TTHERM_00137970 [Tetrahymena thermophila SB210]|eukprot:XP_001019779.2 hypothetical protein TTHERM_00137970 [Tetrahymena thermophila SB210]
MNQNNLFQSTNYFKLDKTFFMRMLELEKLFHEKEINIQQIGELVGMYARCVEYYDSIKDDSKFYYIDKIQYVLSRKESLEKIFKENGFLQQEEQKTVQKTENKQPKDNMLVSDFIVDFNFGDQKGDDREFRINNIRCSIAGRQLPRESVTRRKLQGEYKMNVDFYEHKGEQEYQVRHIVEETEQKFGQYDEIIKKDLNDQDELLMQRIAKKKAKLNQNKKKQVKKANSFDEIDITQNGQNNTEINLGDQTNMTNNIENNTQTTIKLSKNLEEKNALYPNDKKMTKQEQINELKETFDLSYSKLFTSINQKNNRLSVGLKQQQKIEDTQNVFHKDEIQMKLASSQIVENSQEDQLRDSSAAFYNKQNTEDHLESIFSAHGGRITIRGENPFEESDDDE